MLKIYKKERKQWLNLYPIQLRLTFFLKINIATVVVNIELHVADRIVKLTSRLPVAIIVQLSYPIIFCRCDRTRIIKQTGLENELTLFVSFVLFSNVNPTNRSLFRRGVVLLRHTMQTTNKSEITQLLFFNLLQ